MKVSVFARHSRAGRIAVLAVGCMLLLSGVWAGSGDQDKSGAQSGAQSDAKASSGKAQVKTYTNEDLARMFGSSSAGSVPEQQPAPPGSATAKPTSEQPTAQDPTADPLNWLKNQEQAQADKKKRIAEAEAEVAAAQQKVDNLKVQVLATRNPFSKRPELSEEEKEARAAGGEAAAERYERTQQELEDAQRELQEAQTNLAAAKSQ